MENEILKKQPELMHHHMAQKPSKTKSPSKEESSKKHKKGM